MVLGNAYRAVYTVRFANARNPIWTWSKID
jgi:hypothetical protein